MIYGFLISGLIIFFLPNIIYSSSWQEIIGVLNGKYDNDVIGSLKIIEKYGIQSDYTQFFEEKLRILFFISIAILIVVMLITATCVDAYRKEHKNKGGFDMFFWLATLVSGIIIYFLPNMMYSSSWEEIIGVLSGKYNNDIIGSLKIIEKFGVQSDYNQFFQEKLSVLIVLSIAIYIVLLIVCSLLKKTMQKKNIVEKNVNDFESKK